MSNGYLKEKYNCPRSQRRSNIFKGSQTNPRGGGGGHGPHARIQEFSSGGPGQSDKKALTTLGFFVVF